MNRERMRRNIKRNRDYKRYHKRKGYNKGNKIKKAFYIFLSLLLIHFIPYNFQNPVQIWKDDNEEVEIIDEPVDDDIISDNEEVEIIDEPVDDDVIGDNEVDDNKSNTEEDVKIDTESPHFVLDGRWNIGYTRTYYDVDVEGGIISSYGIYWNDENMRVENNFIQYHDEEYGWVNVYALNVDQMKEYGTVVTSTALGSIIEVKLPNSESTHFGIVLDVCGACAKDKKIDVWVKNQYVASENNTHINNEVEFRFVRFGFDGEQIIYKKK
jgi:hypothetical protein